MPPKPLNQISGMPKMAAAFQGWTVPITIKKITQTIVNGFVTDTETTLQFDGTWQPLDPEEIQLKPEGQRSWEWIDLHCMGVNPGLATNDRVEYLGLRYKIMAVKDYSLNNFVEFHLVKDFQNAE